MKYYFFVNPVAGKGKNAHPLVEKIKGAFADLGMEADYRIYRTEAVGDGTKKARALAENLKGEPARFYACGGDGTVNEIVNGIYGFEEASFGIVPIGSGNDTVRNFPETGDFLDMKSQILAEEKPMDLMEYSGIIDGVQQTRYCVNMFNIGFDCDVVRMAAELREKPLISGSLSYLMAIFGTFVKKEGISLDIVEDGKVLKQGKLLLCAISNGSFCGGGIKSAPQSIVDDGIFDINMVKDVSRREFLKFLPYYQKGTHLNHPKVDEVLEIRTSKSLSVKPFGVDTMNICVDGEIEETCGIDIRMIEKGIKILLPAKNSLTGKN